MRRFCWMIMIVVSVLEFGCESDGSYFLQVDFPSEELLQDTADLYVWVVEAESCGDVSWAGLDSGEEASVSSIVVENIAISTAGGVLASVPNGVFVFVAEGRTIGGARILRGCTRVEVKAGATIRVLLDLTCVCEPVPGVCAPIEEITGNGLDDDCDGETDECMSELDCDDDNFCTQDICVVSQCQHPHWPNSTQCDDKNSCTSNDACLDGICTGTGRDCSGFDAVCVRGVCNPASGECEAQEEEDQTPCEDGLFCSEADVCLAGVCVAGGERDCDDEEPCTQDVCNENERACKSTWEPKLNAEGPAGSANCEDGEDNDCDLLVDMDDPDCNPCTVDEDCDDANPCTLNNCADGVCSTSSTNENGSCDDGLYCTEDDVCVGGVCQGEARICTVGDICRVGVCLEDEDRCDEVEKDDGEICDDGQYCTVQDNCQAGVCEGEDRVCEDSDICTLDACDEQLGECTHVAQEIPGAEGPEGNPSCGNGVDDDCDGLTDDWDSECLGLIYELPAPFVGDEESHIDTGWIPPNDQPWTIQMSLTTNDSISSRSSGIWDGTDRTFIGIGLADQVIFGVGDEYEVTQSTSPSTRYDLVMTFDGMDQVKGYTNGELDCTFTTTFNQVTDSFYVGCWSNNGVPEHCINYTVNSLRIANGIHEP